MSGAQKLYEQILSTTAFLPTLRSNLAGIYLSQGRFEDATRLLDLALAENPHHKEALTNRSVLYEKTGDITSARKTLEKVLSLSSATPEAYHNLAGYYLKDDDSDSALLTIERGLQFFPDNITLLEKKASLYQSTNKSQEAISFVASRLSNHSNPASLHHIIAGLYNSIGEHEHALLHIDKAIVSSDSPPEKYISAKASFLHDANRDSESLDLINSSLSQYPHSSDLIKLKGAILQKAGQLQDAVLLYKLALQASPFDSNCLSLLGNVYYHTSQYHNALDTYNRCLSLDPLLRSALLGSSQALFALGRHDDAFEQYKKSTQQHPHDLDVWDSFLYFLSFTNLISSEEIIAACTEYFENAIAPLIKHSSPFLPSHKRPSRIIRLGILSAEIGSHCVSYFLLSLLKGASSAGLEITLYSSRDRSTEPRWAVMRDLASSFYPIHDLSDDDAATLIRSHKLDVLFETTQHMQSNRLPLLARRLAPVQAHYIGMHGTTGVPSIDYFIGDDIITPDNFSPSFTEDLLRLNRCWVCYSPPDKLPRLEDLPSEKPVSFGCFNNSSKITVETLSLWASVLLSFPGSVLYLKDSLKTTSDRQVSVAEFLSKKGVSPDRVIILKRTPSWDAHMELYNLFDISLDTSPLASGTTAFDSLLMGTPLMSISSSWIGGRLSHSIMYSLFGDSWIASTTDEYVEKLHYHLSDLPSFRANTLARRSLFLDSELCDYNSLASSMYTALSSVC